MVIYIDSDSVPAKVRNYLIQLSANLNLKLKFISNHDLKIEKTASIDTIITNKEDQAVDNYILTKINPADMLLTRDYLFADIALDKCSLVFNDRGTVFTREYINKKLEDRKMMDALFAGGFVQHGKKKKYNSADFESFKTTMANILKVD